MKNKITFKNALLTFSFVILVFIASDIAGKLSNLAAGYANAPGNSNCTNCHSSSLYTSGTVYNNITITQATPYGLGTSTSPYTFNLNVNCPGHTRIGFQLIVLPVGATSTTASLGTLGIPSVSTGLIQIVTSGTRSYIEHTSTGTSTTTGAKSWTFTWVPATSGFTGNVVFYVAMASTNSNNNESGDTIYAKAITFNVLPVRWNSFDAVITGRNVILNWSTASEINNDYFEVERSSDQNAWEIISKVKGSSNSSVIHKYSAYDENVKSGDLYYRVKQVDFDGRFDYSKTIKLELDDLSDINIYPVPTTETLHISGAKWVNQINLINSSGTLLKTFRPENYEINIDLSDFKNGIYFLRFETEKGVILKRFPVVL